MGKKGNRQKGFIDKSALSKKDTKFINKKALTLDEFDKEGNSANVFVSIKHIQSDFECFSEWSKQEMNAFWNFNTDIHNKTWQQVYSTARKKKKTGLAYTTLPKKTFPPTDFRNKLSDDITLFELRVNNTIRVHGFRHKFVFYICWLDRNHKITDK